MIGNILRAGLLAFIASLASPAAEPLHWIGWSDSVFEQARRENRFVLLDLEAVWCHWCHVMDETTYRDPAVIALLQSRYILVRVDQDSRPDLSNRYEDYGWPATVVFNAKGGEIVKRQGYIPPKPMASMLRAIVDDPTPGPSVKPAVAIQPASAPHLDAALRAQLNQAYREQYDSKNGSWGFAQKYLDWDSVELAIERAERGDAAAERMAKQTLTAQLNLLDPAWGGVYQYSTDGDWKHPHFEKIMSMQSGNLRVYALGWQHWRDPAYLKAATEIHRYLTTFLLSPDGVFYTSQDADLIPGEHSAAYFGINDAGRRKLGIPKVDRHIYARENGWVIDSLALLYGVTGEQGYLREARRAANWVTGNRSLPGGGFKHGAENPAVYLGDTLAMSRAFLSLYAVTGDRDWLKRSEKGVKFIVANFNARTRDENASLARLCNLLARYSGENAYRDIAAQAMRYLASPTVARKFPVATALLVDAELSSEPLHLTIVGPKTDPAARALFTAAAQVPTVYKVLEWWDPAEGPMPNPEVQYPELKRPAAFLCTANSCSPPIYDVDRLLSRSRMAFLRSTPQR